MAGQVSWTVEFYQDERGNKPVEAFLNGLPVQERAQCQRMMARLREYGLALGPPDVKPIEGRLWELWPGPNRIFYFVYTGRRFVLLHGYRKKPKSSAARDRDSAPADG